MIAEKQHVERTRGKSGRTVANGTALTRVTIQTTSNRPPLTLEEAERLVIDNFEPVYRNRSIARGATHAAYAASPHGLADPWPYVIDVFVTTFYTDVTGNSPSDHRQTWEGEPERRPDRDTTLKRIKAADDRVLRVHAAILNFERRKT